MTLIQNLKGGDITLGTTGRELPSGAQIIFPQQCYIADNGGSSLVVKVCFLPYLAKLVPSLLPMLPSILYPLIDIPSRYRGILGPRVAFPGIFAMLVPLSGLFICLTRRAKI